MSLMRNFVSVLPKSDGKRKLAPEQATWSIGTLNAPIYSISSLDIMEKLNLFR